MSIDPARSRDTRTRVAGAIPEVTPAEGDATETAVRRDHVEISEGGLSLASTRQTVLSSPEVRMSEVWDRLLGGFYDQEAVREAIAECIVHSGDL